MGYDLPAALGAARCGKSHMFCRRRCSLQMDIQELQTPARTGANVVVFVINNGGYLSIWQTHENFFWNNRRCNARIWS